jgi:hypothetical protein
MWIFSLPFPVLREGATAAYQIEGAERRRTWPNHMGYLLPHTREHFQW